MLIFVISLLDSPLLWIPGSVTPFIPLCTPLIDLILLFYYSYYFGYLLGELKDKGVQYTGCNRFKLDLWD